jgi:hypothetical protein
MSSGIYTNIAKKRVEQAKEASNTSQVKVEPSPAPAIAPVDQDNKNSRNPEFKNTRKLDNHNPRIQEIKNTSNQVSFNSGNPELKNSRIPEIRMVATREFYQKATYRLSDDALVALEDAKKILKRNYGLKVNLEEIVESSILYAFEDLIEKKEKSLLLSKYSGKQENQKT